jgi:hypothetical protein
MEDAVYQLCLILAEAIPPRVKCEKLFEDLPGILARRFHRGRFLISQNGI